MPKEKIPQAVRSKVWTTYINENDANGECYVGCGTKIRLDKFECGHVLSEFNQGKATIENLRPICTACNRSIGSRNMKQFVKEHGFNSKLLTEITDEDTIKRKSHNDKSHIKIVKNDTETEDFVIISDDESYEKKSIMTKKYYIADYVIDNGYIRINDQYINPNHLKDKESKFKAKKNIIDTCNKIINGLIKHQTVLMTAPTQSGKSVVIGRTLEILMYGKNILKDYDMIIKPINMYIILCMSSNDSLKSLKEKFSDITGFYNCNVIHISNVSKIKLNQNEKYAFIFDEIHMCLDTGSTLDHFMKYLEKYDTVKLLISATPFEHIKHKNDFKINMIPDETYTSAKDLHELGLVRQAFDFKESLKNVDEYMDEIMEDVLDCDCKGFIIVRLPISRKIPNLQIKVMGKFLSYCKKRSLIPLNIDHRECFTLFDQTENRPIDEILKKNIEHLHFIFVKNMLRASKSLPYKSKIISVHDACTNTYSHVTMQSFLGRMTGHDANLKCSIYCDEDKALQAIKALESNYVDLPIKMRKNTYLVKSVYDEIANFLD